MIQTNSISNIIDNFDLLSVEEKEYALDIFKKNIIESKRENLLQRIEEAKNNYGAGNVKKGNLKELYRDLEDD